MVLPSSPLGSVILKASPFGLTNLEIVSRQTESMPSREKNTILAEAVQQLIAYFDGALRQFNLPIDWTGITGFQEQVLRATAQIPYGETRTYGEIARALNKPTGSRAVGHALAANPLPIILPCHRVIGADNSMRGFSAPGGVTAKAWLLTLEGARLL